MLKRIVIQPFFEDNQVAMMGRIQISYYRHFITLFVGANGAVQRDIFACFALCSQLHQDFVLNATCGIGCEFCPFSGLIGVDRLNKSDCANGD